MINKNVTKLLSCSLLVALVSSCVTTSADDSNTVSSGNTNKVVERPTLTPTPTPTPVIVKSGNELRTLRIWLDDSGSQNFDLFVKYIDEIVSNIAIYRTRISGVEVIRFSHGNRSIEEETTEKFLWGSLPEEKSFEPNMENAPPDAKLFVEARNKFIEEQRKQFDENKEKKQTDYDNLVESKLKDLKSYLSQKTKITAPCTRFMSLTARMKSENLPYNLVITDGFADCADETEDTISQVELDGKNAVVQLTTITDSGKTDKEIEKRKHFLELLFSPQSIFPVYKSKQALELLFPMSETAD